MIVYQKIEKIMIIYQNLLFENVEKQWANEWIYYPDWQLKDSLILGADLRLASGSFNFSCYASSNASSNDNWFDS